LDRFRIKDEIGPAKGQKTKTDMAKKLDKEHLIPAPQN
jgi:hypothetical protein